MSTGKLTVTKAIPSIAVNLPIHPVGAMPRAIEGSICFNPDNGKMYLYTKNSDGNLIWQETQRQ